MGGLWGYQLVFSFSGSSGLWSIDLAADTVLLINFSKSSGAAL
jgi:hypothetical protein